jgi:hypothetical protein
MANLSRNDRCPCGTGKKYKHCCLGVVNWDAIKRDRGDRYRYLSIRGRNLAFRDLLCDLLLLDSHRQLRSLNDYKKAFTAENVRKLNEGIARIWPPDLDIEAALRSTGGGVSGLYVGDYSKDQLLRGIVRHTTYASKLLVCDPFIYPLSVREEYSPIHNPDQHRSQTLLNVNVWLSLIPWVEAGLVEVIRTPCDFDPRLNWNSMKAQEEKFATNPELKKAADVTVKELMQRHADVWKFRDMVLTMPDGALLDKFQRIIGDDKKVSKEDLLTYVHQCRAADPDFLEPLGPNNSGQLQMISSGASYNIACIIAELTDSYLVTDLHVKWKEIEFDRCGRAEEVDAWSPFAKAMQNASLKYLDDVSLEDALALRKDGRLEDLRAFLRKVWTQACDTKSYATVNGRLFAEELQGEIRKAEEEWKQIDRDLIKNAGAAGAGLMVSAPMISTGQGLFLASAAIIAGLSSLGASAWQRRGFPTKYPAAFFLGLGR